MRLLMAALLCAFGCGALQRPNPARALDSAIAVLEKCDAAAYPEVSCELVLRNRRGDPIDDVQAGDVTVESAGAPARVLSLRKLADPAVRMHVTVLVDPGVPMRSMRALNDAASRALDAIDPGDALLWRVAGASVDAPSASPLIENDAASARAAIQALLPDPRARFYDALCDEVEKSASRKQIARVIIAIGDGRDAPARSALGPACALDEAVALARAHGVPIISIGVGAADHRALNRLAQASGGLHIAAGAKNAIAHAFAQIAWRQRARYRLRFDAWAAPALTQRMAVVRVRAGMDTLQAAQTFVPMPAAPIVDWPELAAAGAPVAPQALPMEQQIRLTPRVLGRHIERVEYTLGARTEVAARPPFSLTLDTAMLDPNVPTALKIRAYGSVQDMRLYGERVVLLAVADTAAAHALAQAGLGAEAAPAPSVSISLAGVAGLATTVVTLLGGAAIALRARRSYAPPRPHNALAADAAFGVRHARVGGDAQTLVRAVVAPPAAEFGHSASGTHLINAAAPGEVASGGLRLRVSSGAQAGRDIVVPASADGLVLGRAPCGAHAVTLPSAFLSAAHARFDMAGGLHVTDLNSSNGTRKNGERLAAHARVALQPGDAVTLADIELRVVAV